MNIWSLQCFPSSVALPDNRERQWVPGPLEGWGLVQSVPSLWSVSNFHVPVLRVSPKAGEGDGLAAEVAQVDEAGGLRGTEVWHRHQQHPLPLLPCKHRWVSGRGAPRQPQEGLGVL